MSRDKRRAAPRRAAPEAEEDITAEPSGRRGPSRAAEPPPGPGLSRRTVLAGLIITIVVLLVAGAAAYFINAAQPATPSAPPSSRWALALPVQVGQYSRDPNGGSTPSSGGGRTTISATYSRNGKAAYVVLMSRPENDPKRFMDEAAMSAVSEQSLSDRSGAALCGTSSDSNATGCVVMKDNTAVLAMGLADQSRQDIADMARATGRAASS